MKLNLLVLTTEKPGHYRSYGELCAVLSGGGCVRESATVKDMLRCSSLVLVDGDSKHLSLFLVVIMRALMRRKTLFLSVRTEDFLISRLKSLVKRALVRALIKFKSVSFVSIHYPSFCEYEGHFLSACIYDPQLWDLPFLRVKESFPKQLKYQEGYLLVLGALNEKRCKGELLASLESLENIPIVFAGKMDVEYEMVLKKFNNIKILNRYISDEEIYGLYRNAGLVYSYYSNDVKRPSGIFGRAVQYSKPVVVRASGYLDQNYNNYPGLISISSLSELRGAVEKSNRMRDSLRFTMNFDHSDVLRSML